MSNTPFLQLRSLCKNFGEGLVLDHLSLDIQEGEFLTLLGPSGCGKTTTLRIIAGLEIPTAGEVYLEGENITTLPPEKRPLNTVFQNYALFPHMNVQQNIAYGLRFLGISKAEQKKRVEEALSLVRLSGYEKRMPAQLSGGQRQRIAIARAVVLKPKVLLLDEPLGALDLKLRQDMQQELKALQETLGITFIYITHDQEEALNMSSRIVVMRNGKIEQLGTPSHIYEKPKTRFVADFIGQSNLITGTLSQVTEDGHSTLQVGQLQLPVWIENHAFKKGDTATLCLRPQRIHYGKHPRYDMTLTGVINSKNYAGGMQHTIITLGDSLSLSAFSQTEALDSYPVGSQVHVGWDVYHAPLVAEDEVTMA